MYARLGRTVRRHGVDELGDRIRRYEDLKIHPYREIRTDSEEDWATTDHPVKTGSRKAIHAQDTRAKDNLFC